MSILGQKWLDVEKNDYGVKKIKLDIDNSVISIEPGETKLKIVGVNHLEKGNKFEANGEEFIFEEFLTEENLILAIDTKDQKRKLKIKDVI